METKIILNLLLIANVATLVSSQKAQKCTVDADVGIILDSSGSIKNYYRQEKNFLNSIAASFGIGSGKSRASVVTFSKFSVLSIKFSQYDTLAKFQAAVNRIPHMNSVTFMDRALRLAQKEKFTLKNGARPGKAKLLILLTDGAQTTYENRLVSWIPRRIKRVPVKYEDPAAVVKDLRKDGINVIVVGMGKGVNMPMIEKIAGGSKFAFYANDFKKLATPAFLNDVKARSCVAAEESLTINDPCPEKDVDYKGNDIKLDLNLSTWKECAVACKRNPACKFFTFVSDSGCCYHKSRFGGKSKAPGLISGKPDCLRK